MATEIEGEAMCLSSTSNLIDFKKLKPKQKQKLKGLIRKLKLHKKVLAGRIVALDKGLRVLDRKMKA
jgi:hypothetical protein